MAKPGKGQQAAQVFEAGKRKCSVTGNTVIYWKLVRYQEPPAPKPEHEPTSLFR